ncbi:discoidin domain-containing protein [Flavobacterium sp.]|uniref:discoidin domain-containing protein n=1 Tax=Flavobacterium sp. TaxID=239 RepID=UPI003448767B
MEIVIDLEKVQSIEKVAIGTLESQGAGIYFPTQLKVLVSKDSINYKEVGKIKRPFAVNVNSELKDFKINFVKQEVRFVKVIATNLKKAPTGGSSWLFVDEILVD